MDAKPETSEVCNALKYKKNDKQNKGKGGKEIVRIHCAFRFWQFYKRKWIIF